MLSELSMKTFYYLEPCSSTRELLLHAKPKHFSILHTYQRGPSRGFGEQGERVIISGEHRPNFEGSKDNIGEQGTKENKFSFLWGTSQFISGNKPVYFRETREQVHPLGGPHQISGTDSL